MDKEKDISSQYECSNFVRDLVQLPDGPKVTSALSNKIPNTVVQFWNDFNEFPEDVKQCIETWKKVEKYGVQSLLFDDKLAREFISYKLGIRHLRAYNNCYHPAMQADYFRLCYISIEGGCYIDADDAYNGGNIQDLFNDGRLKIQPLCYDSQTHMMVPPQIFTKKGANENGWIFYFNNNPLVATSSHPIVEHALEQATSLLEKDLSQSLPEIQSTTGPGNLTNSVFELVYSNELLKGELLILKDWESIANTKWELSYRNDSRNWRNSNSKRYL